MANNTVEAPGADEPRVFSGLTKFTVGIRQPEPLRDEGNAFSSAISDHARVRSQSDDGFQVLPPGADVRQFFYIGEPPHLNGAPDDGAILISVLAL